MNIALSKYDIRRIYISYLTKQKKVYLYPPYKFCKGDTIDAEIDYESEELYIPNIVGIKLKDLFNYKNSDLLIGIDNQGIVEMYTEYKFSEYRFISNGELDYPNITINGKTLFRKKYPIHTISEKITGRIRGYDEILFIGSKLGYYIQDYLNNNKSANILLYEYDSDLFKVNKFNPCARKFYEFIDKKVIDVNLDSLYNILNDLPRSKVIVYLPPPFTRDNTHFYSWKTLKYIANSLEKRGKLVIDIDIPFSRTVIDLIESISNKLTRLGIKTLSNLDYGIIIGYKK